MTGADLARLSLTEFLWLVGGLSDKSRWLSAWHAAPKHVYDPAQIEAITAAARA